MSREIKYRGINSASREMVEIDDVCVIDWMHDEVYFENGTDVSTSISDAKLMQYTGIQDNYGVLVYDQDIVDAFGGHTQGVVEMHEGCWSIKTRDGYESLYEAYNQCELEVIGNIHQNPELLNEQ